MRTGRAHTAPRGGRTLQGVQSRRVHGAQWLRGCQGLGKGSGVTADGDGDSLPEEIVGLVAQSVNVLNTIELHTLNR